MGSRPQHRSECPVGEGALEVGGVERRGSDEAGDRDQLAEREACRREGDKEGQIARRPIVERGLASAQQSAGHRLRLRLGDSAVRDGRGRNRVKGGVGELGDAGEGTVVAFEIVGVRVDGGHGRLLGLVCEDRPLATGDDPVNAVPAG